MAVNPIERAVGRFLLGPVLRVVKVGVLLLMVVIGFALSNRALAFLTSGEWGAMPIPFPGLLANYGGRVEPLAWLVLYLGILNIVIFGGRLFYHREIAHYRDWKKAEGHFRAVEQRKSFADGPELNPADDNNPPSFPLARE